MFCLASPLSLQHLANDRQLLTIRSKCLLRQFPVSQVVQRLPRTLDLGLPPRRILSYPDQILAKVEVLADDGWLSRDRLLEPER